MKRLFIFALAAAASIAHAGTTTTEGAPSFELHAMPANTIVSPWPKTEQECVDKAKASLGHWQCVTRRNFDTVGTCADVPKPAFPVKVDADGFLLKPALRVPVDEKGNWGATEMEGFVAAPYPACWVMGWVPYVPEVEPDHGTVDEPVCKPLGRADCPVPAP